MGQVYLLDLRVRIFGAIEVGVRVSAAHRFGVRGNAYSPV